MAKKPTLLIELPKGEALKKALAMSQESVIEDITKSNLRGRGGAGFPTGVKMGMVRCADGESIVVCNADEGEAGTFKDRHLIENYPEKLLEGMAIACYAVGTKTAVIYLRWEYSYLRDHLQKVLDHYENDLTDIDFEIELGGGAYVCGEETALLDSLEGQRGEARNKPPYPVLDGYRHRPTLINNVETFCCIPHIILEGPKFFCSMMTPDKAGRPKLFSVSGDVKKPGVYEFPLGTSLTSVLKKVEAVDPKAALVGGASGICVGKKDFKRKLAFDDLPPGGSIIVFNNKRKMIDVLKNVMEFFVEESCGQCTPCREGNKQLSLFVDKIIKTKQVTQKELDRYIELADIMKISAKCGLGQSSPNPFLSIMETFNKEFVKINK